MSRDQLLVLAGCVVLSAIITGLVRRYAVLRHVLDRPGPRSSHQHPTPRGGGSAVAGASFAAILAAAALGWVDRPLAQALVGGGVIVAGVGWMDDHRSVSARARLIVHFTAASWAVWRLGGLPELELGLAELHLGTTGGVLAVFGIVWCINFYNFMDGIDGIAAVQGLAAGGIGSALLLAAGRPGLAFASAAVAAAVAGFLPWNWSPAKIFLGDVGSGLLGFLFAVLAVGSENRGGPPVAVWSLLLGVFVFDATVTLVRRGLRRENLATGHREHAYQRAVQAGWTHQRVTVAVAVLNVMLGGLAVAAMQRPYLLPWCIVGSIGLLVAAYLVVERWRPMFSQAR